MAKVMYNYNVIIKKRKFSIILAEVREVKHIQFGQFDLVKASYWVIKKEYININYDKHIKQDHNDDPFIEGGFLEKDFQKAKRGLIRKIFQSS